MGRHPEHAANTFLKCSAVSTVDHSERLAYVAPVSSCPLDPSMALAMKKMMDCNGRRFTQAEVGCMPRQCCAFVALCILLMVNAQ